MPHRWKSHAAAHLVFYMTFLMGNNTGQIEMLHSVEIFNGHCFPIVHVGALNIDGLRG